MRKLSAALIILLGLANAALAQTKFTMPPPGGVTVVGVQVVTSCGAASGLAANNVAYLAMDTTGVLCTSVSGGGITAAVTVADGADVTLGAKADAICGTATGTCTLMALVKFLNTAATSSIPAGTAIIGKVGIDQTTPGTTNGVVVNSSAIPTGASTSALQSTGNTSLSSIDTKVPALGQALAAASVPVILPAATITTLTPPTTVTANLGTLNGAATAAKQPALGTSGAASADVITTQAPAPDPCHVVTATYTPISITSSTTTRIVAPTSAKRTYICYMFLISAIANNIAVVEGTGGTCGSSTAGVIGGTTAANGLNLAANSGAVFQAGGNVAVATAGTNVDLCLITSSAGPVAGHIKWVQAP